MFSDRFFGGNLILRANREVTNNSSVSACLPSGWYNSQQWRWRIFFWPSGGYSTLFFKYSQLRFPEIVAKMWQNAFTTQNYESQKLYLRYTVDRNISHEKSFFHYFLCVSLPKLCSSLEWEDRIFFQTRRQAILFVTALNLFKSTTNPSSFITWVHCLA